MAGLAEVFRRYAAFVSANDVAGIVSLYAPNATGRHTTFAASTADKSSSGRRGLRRPFHSR